MQTLAQPLTAGAEGPQLNTYGAATHEVFNQPFELADYNLFWATPRSARGWRARARPQRTRTWRRWAPGLARPKPSNSAR